MPRTFDHHLDAFAPGAFGQFAKRLQFRQLRPVGGIADNALDCLRSYTWPGNVSELESVLKQAINNGATEQIELRDLPASLRVRDAHQVRAESPERQLCLEEAEKQAIRRALHYARGNKRKAARLLHIGKTTLYRKLKAYDLE